MAMKKLVKKLFGKFQESVTVICLKIGSMRNRKKAKILIGNKNE
jgi:hypothetical protein